MLVLQLNHMVIDLILVFSFMGNHTKLVGQNNNIQSLEKRCPKQDRIVLVLTLVKVFKSN